MKLKPIGSNQTVLYTNHGDEVLYSYETPVAGFKRGLGWFKTSEKYSVTTSRHINKYLDGREALELSPESIEEMFS